MTKVVPTKPLFIMLYGYPGAGKTYFARQLTDHLQAAHVHSERIRGELFETPRYDKEENQVVAQLVDYLAIEFLNAGLSVIYDGEALRANQRKALREMALKAKAQPLLIWFQIDPESAFARLGKRDRRRSDDKYAGPGDLDTFQRTAASMQNPQNEECIVISGKYVFSSQLSSFMARLRELGLVQATNNVAANKVVKPALVNLVPNIAAGRVDLSRRNIIIR